MPDATLRIGDVERGPVLVGEGVPNGVVVVDRDRVLDLQLARCSSNVVDVVLDVELRRVHADDDEPVLGRTCSPTRGGRAACGAS